ncbi:MAG: (Fe-S)-binding protein [Saprospiraceae bacterium]|nr:(Fe-S)-binding protein [Saprospiraceae bacterium]
MQQIIFIVLTGIVSFFAYKKFRQIYQNILLGKSSDMFGDTAQRWQNVIFVAFGQKKMFKNWIPAIFHLFIYVAFLFTQVELIEIIIDGVFGVHRFFAPFLGGLYTLIISSIEVLSLLALVATFVFLYRRNFLKVPRLVKSELNGWPKLDANLILIGELLLVTGIFTMNGADSVLQGIDPTHYPETGSLAISSWFGPAVFGGMEPESLMFVERFGWWLHLLVVLGFISYLPYSKHLHIFLAFPNVYFSKLTPRGEMENMPEIMNEVKSMLGMEADTSATSGGEMPEFGSKDVFDLSWKNILNAYSCTECGRCSAVCPANLTGKKLSPRKIMMDIRDRATEIGNNIASGDLKYAKTKDNTDIKTLTADNYDDGKSLFDYISREELHACTTCNACVEACPILIDPLEPILKMRRYEILTESAGPGDWVPMFTAMENGGCVWQMPVEREAWRAEV